MTSTLKPVTLITGASGGIGAELARVFARNDHALALVARRAPQLKALADSIASAGQARPLVIATDLARADAVAHIAAELHAAGLEPQYVVNSAGFGLLGQAAELDRADQLAMIDLNVRVLTELSLRFIESLARHRGGILNVASVAGFMPAPGMAVYHATKAYALSLSEALHHELGSRGVRVTVLCPGPVETEFQARAKMPAHYFPNLLLRSTERVAREGYDGLMQGRRVVVPGSDNKVLSLLPRFLPRRLVLAFMQRHHRRRVT
jgi:short-subunit dehydrogenase